MIFEALTTNKNRCVEYLTYFNFCLTYSLNPSHAKSLEAFAKLNNFKTIGGKTCKQF